MRTRRDATTGSRLDVLSAPLARVGGPGAFVPMLVAGVAFVMIAHRADEAVIGRGTMLALTIGAVGAVAWASAGLLAWAGRPTTRVFQSRPLTLATAALSGVAACTVARLLWSRPFEQVLATGRFHNDDIADVGCVVIAVESLVAAVVGAESAWTARGTERHWQRAPEP